MFICTVGGGSTMAMPDVCKTPAPPAPPIPLPYPNMAQMVMGMPPVQNVLVSGAPALNKASKIPLSSGDEPGVAGGVVSGTFIQEVEFIMGSMIVTIGGKPAVRLGDPVKANKGNAVGSVIAPSQAVVMAN
jgi:uncharacterized Zn-binding protein involved in type VI secretion